MFIYGRAPERCKEDGRCACNCESSSFNGKCTTTYHSGYNLYKVRRHAKVITYGKIIMNISFFVTSKNFSHDQSLTLIKFASKGVIFFALASNSSVKWIVSQPLPLLLLPPL